ncbi:hypothetical protein FF38_00981 [Lucilia cuprina]|uniref:Uncharacterized protein n=1 Tax=Lucilia cuprina TaxID=7375 RepID=A0A0L0BU78_LUCCU|nr:hypothetical protein FF38_00981 [Lucilia cuprina]
MIPLLPYLLRSPENKDLINIKKLEIYKSQNPGGTAIPGQPVTEVEQAPKAFRLSTFILPLNNFTSRKRDHGLSEMCEIYWLGETNTEYLQDHTRSSEVLMYGCTQSSITRVLYYALYTLQHYNREGIMGLLNNRKKSQKILSRSTKNLEKSQTCEVQFDEYDQHQYSKILIATAVTLDRILYR